MSRILQIKSSPRGELSVSNQLGDELCARLQQLHPGAEHIERNLAEDPLPHITPDFSTGTLTPPDQRSPQQIEALKLSDSVLAELMQSDHIVVSVAMINFSIPSVLKVWIDHLLRYGVAFTYDEQGNSVGLVNGKRLYLVMARGSAYGPDRRDWDFQSTYLEKIFQFIGMEEQTHILAESTLAGEEIANANIAKARERIAAIGG